MVSLVQATPVINEFLAANNFIHPDNSDFEDYSDWIELHNPAVTNVSLASYFLTDDLTQPFQWLFPTNAVIPANGYLMIRADGHDAAPGQARVRGYYPWGSTFTTRRYHANFKLSAEGEAVGLYRTESAPQDVMFIPTNAIWKYLVAVTNPGPSWMTLAFDDFAWSQGPAELGCGVSALTEIVTSRKRRRCRANAGFVPPFPPELCPAQNRLFHINAF